MPVEAEQQEESEIRKRSAEAGVSLHVYDGRLDPGVATLFSGGGAVLVARREATRVATWELELLRRFLGHSALLPSGSPMREVRLSTMEDLAGVTDLVRQVLAGWGAARASQDVASDVAYEMASNALLAAPADDEGRPRYAHRRHLSPEIDPQDGCRLELTVHQDLLFLCAQDRFGRLTPEPIARTLSGLGKRAQVDASGGGAGLGFRRLIDHGEVVAARVAPKRSTEVLCVVSLNGVRRRSAGLKSVFFLTERE